MSAIQQNERLCIPVPVSAIARYAFANRLLCAPDNEVKIDGNRRLETEELFGEIERRESRTLM